MRLLDDEVCSSVAGGYGIAKAGSGHIPVVDLDCSVAGIFETLQFDNILK